MLHRNLVLALSLLAAPASAQDMTAEVKNLTQIGFQQLEDVSRFFVRTNEPATYRIENASAEVITLVLDNTRIALANNARPLDTRYFDSTVSYIKPKTIEEPATAVRIDIRLRRRVPFKPVQTDNLITIDFPR